MLESAATADLPAAHFVLGVLGEQVAVQRRRSCGRDRALPRSRAAGHRAAQFRYGIALMNGRGVDRDTLNGETWLRRAGLAGELDAAAMVGDLYSRQGELPPNFCEAAMWFQRAAEAGHVGAARALGQLCVIGGGFGSDPVTAAHGCAWRRPRAICWQPMSWESAWPMASAHRATMPRRLQWFQCAIDVMPTARYWCARMLDEGRGTAQDLPAARAGFLRAAAEGIGDAAAIAGEMLVNGRGGPADWPAAMVLFRDAAARGTRPPSMR